MPTLTPDECRVLGVLVEKAMTTPAQYPLTLNALVTGSNQKNNRDPVTGLDEDRVLDAIQGLRHKGLALVVDMAGSRVQKYRHVAREAMAVETPGLVIMTELLLRGPQTLGELRTRASRMHPLESLDVVEAVLDGLMSRPEPLVRRLPPSPGSRAERFVQLLCPDLHPLDAAPSPRSTDVGSSSGDLSARVAALEAQVAALQAAVESLRGG